jgi:hypothetical protein
MLHRLLATATAVAFVTAASAAFAADKKAEAPKVQPKPGAQVIQTNPDGTTKKIPLDKK